MRNLPDPSCCAFPKLICPFVRREYEKAVAGWERALKRPHGLQPIAPIETSWWSIKEAEEKKRRRAEEAALAKALEDKNKPAGKKDDKKKGKGKKEKGGG